MAAFDSFGKHAIHRAARSGNVKELQAEIDKGTSVDLRATDSDKDTALIIASRINHFAAMKLLVDNKASVDASSAEGITSLHCCYSQKPEFAQLLLDAKASIDKQNEAGDNVLSLAAYHGNEPLVKFLLQRKASTALRNNHGESALDMARQRKNDQPQQTRRAIVALLVIAFHLLHLRQQQRHRRLPQLVRH